MAWTASLHRRSIAACDFCVASRVRASVPIWRTNVERDSNVFTSSRNFAMAGLTSAAAAAWVPVIIAASSDARNTAVAARSSG